MYSTWAHIILVIVVLFLPYWEHCHWRAKNFPFCNRNIKKPQNNPGKQNFRRTRRKSNSTLICGQTLSTLDPWTIMATTQRVSNSESYPPPLFPVCYLLTQQEVCWDLQDPELVLHELSDGSGFSNRWPSGVSVKQIAHRHHQSFPGWGSVRL